jgi:hypothetical protein
MRRDGGLARSRFVAHGPASAMQVPGAR